ncbi:MAG: hypothetical protein MJK08_13795 [Campylobacterales bacterium]|nr:hypothetical protein [Campylobacterales bacterium]
MNLPHLKPIRFVDKLISRSDNSILVKCEFPYLPSLAMLSESAAQSSFFFSKDTENNKIGFLVRLKNIKIKNEIKDKSYFLKIIQNVQVDKLSEYSFEVLNNDIIYAEGRFTIVLQK